MKQIIKYVVLGYTIGVCLHHYNPPAADLNLMVLIPYAIDLDNLYVALQAFNNPVPLAPAFSLIKETQAVYAELLPILGYDFLSQFEEVQLIEFYLQAIDFNIELSLEQFLINSAYQVQATLLCVSQHQHYSNLKQHLFSSII
jgi:hypothetical protein